jgi:regulatory protein
MDERDAPDVSDAAAAEQGHKPRRRRPEPTPVQRALSLLVRREHSRKELTRKLAARGVEAEEARAAVERMTAEGWQDDARFAEQLVRSRANNGYGPLRIRAELGTHGLDREAVAAALAAWDGDWDEQARDLVRRRFPGGFDDPATRRKAADFLIRRGFSADQVRAATRFDPDED